VAVEYTEGIKYRVHTHLLAINVYLFREVLWKMSSHHQYIHSLGIPSD
jgi:hypothetical protein